MLYHIVVAVLHVVVNRLTVSNRNTVQTFAT